MVGRWIGFLFVLSCVLELAVTGSSADYKPEYKMSIVVGPMTFWGIGGAKFAELVKERQMAGSISRCITAASATRGNRPTNSSS
ncbi:MAG TPA: hypothetical protein VFG29_00835 [Syntrophales bacterium]|nr:hypothetical protein [Syntrophales bacterium]